MENKTGQPEITKKNLKWQDQGDCRKRILRVVQAVKFLFHETKSKNLKYHNNRNRIIIKRRDVGVNWQQTFELMVSTDHTLNAGINYPGLSFTTCCTKKCFQ